MPKKLSQRRVAQLAETVAGFMDELGEDKAWALCEKHAVEPLAAVGNGPSYLRYHRLQGVPRS